MTRILEVLVDLWNFSPVGAVAVAISAAAVLVVVIATALWHTRSGLCLLTAEVLCELGDAAHALGRGTPELERRKRQYRLVAGARLQNWGGMIQELAAVDKTLSVKKTAFAHETVREALTQGVAKAFADADKDRRVDLLAAMAEVCQSAPSQAHEENVKRRFYETESEAVQNRTAAAGMTVVVQPISSVKSPVQ